MADLEKATWENNNLKISKDVLICERSLKHIYDDEEFVKDRRDILRSREESFSRTRKRLQSFKTALHSIKDKLEDIVQGRAGAEVIQQLLESFEKKLTDYKIVMRDDYIDLENEEADLTREMQIAANRFDGWMVADEGAIKPEDVQREEELRHRRAISDRRLAEELERQTRIGAIDKQLIAMGGRNLGWDYRDHDGFIREWTRIGCNPTPKPTPTPAASSSSQRNDTQSITSPKRPTSSSSSSPNKLSKRAGDGSNAADALGGTDSSLLITGTGLGNAAEVSDETKLPLDSNMDIQDVYATEISRLSRESGIGIGGDPSKGKDRERDSAIVLTIPRHLRSSLLRRLPIAVPGKSEEEFEEHIDLYLKYLALNIEKKKLLLRWKEEKITQDKANELALERSVAMGGSGKGRGKGGIDDVEQVLDEAAKDIEERAEMRLKVTLWREQKQQEAMKKQAEEEARQSERRLREAEERKRRQMMNRVHLEHWKEAEKNSKAQKKQEQDEAEKRAKRASSADPAEIRRRRERDLQMIQDRKEKIEAHQRQRRPRVDVINEITANVEFDVKRDPQRLVAPTKAYTSQMLSGEYLDDAERRRATAPAHSANIAMSGRDLKFAARATPAWRKGLN